MTKQRGFWGRMPDAATFDRRLPAEAKVVLMAFASHVNAQGRCWPSLDSIGERLGIKRRMVQKHTKLLGDLGYLVREGTMQTPDGYWVKVWKVLYPDPDEVAKTSPEYVSGKQVKAPKAYPEDVSKEAKASSQDASKTYCQDTQANCGDTKAYSQYAPYMELAQKNTLNRTLSLEGAHFTTRQGASSDDDDIPLGDDYGWEGNSDEAA